MTGEYNEAVAKRVCMQRAGWRLTPGKMAARLSEHYKLDCDYGTAVIDIYRTGDGSDPVYLCEKHVGEVKPRKVSGAEIRLVAPVGDIEERSVDAAPASDETVQRVQIAATRSGGATLLKAVPAALPAAPKRIERTHAERSFVYGNAAKALVDESIWNLATGDYELYQKALQLGRSPGEAAQAAGGQLAVVYRKICEYSVKLETVLAASTARIDAREAIDEVFERAMLNILSDEATAESVKEKTIDELGAVQQAVNGGRDAEVTPLQAYRIACAIAERANWGGENDLREELKPALNAIYGSVRKALRAAVPHANHLEERLTNLYAAKADLEKRPATRTLQSLTA